MAIKAVEMDPDNKDNLVVGLQFNSTCAHSAYELKHVCNRRERVESVNFHSTSWNRSRTQLVMGQRVYKVLYRLKFRAVDVG